MKRKSTDGYPGIRVFPESSFDDLDEPSTSSRTRPKWTAKDRQEEENHFEQYSFGRALRKTWADFCNESTIHGLRYLNSNRNRWESVFWIILLLIGVAKCIYLIHMQYERWQSNPVILTFSEREIPVSHIPFPAITICTETKFVKTSSVNFTRFFNYIRRYADKPWLVEPPVWLTADEYLKMRALLQVCGNYLVDGIHFPDYPPMRVVDHLNDMAPPFESNFLFCRFNQTNGDCAPLFEKIYTKEGVCYSFNALNETELYRTDTHQYHYFEEDEHVRKRHKDVDWSITKGYADKDNNYDTYPERVLGSGMNAGLLVVMQGHLENVDYICRGPVQGFKVILHSPDDVPQVDKHFFLVPFEQDVLILVKPLYTTDYVRHYHPDRRRCYYPEERYLRFFQFYTQNNCEMECLSNFTLRKCGCVQFSMPRLLKTKVCDAAHISCYDRAEDAFLLSEFTGLGRDEEKCNCLPGCWAIDYSVEISHGIFNIDKVVESHGDKDFIEHFKKAEVSRLTIYFRGNEFTAWKRTEFFGTADFLAHCGGLYGLLMGVTAVNFIELIYYWTVCLFRNSRYLSNRNIG